MLVGLLNKVLSINYIGNNHKSQIIMHNNNVPYRPAIYKIFDKDKKRAGQFWKVVILVVGARCKI